MTTLSHNPLERLVRAIQTTEDRRRRHAGMHTRQALGQIGGNGTVPMVIPEGQTWRIKEHRCGLAYEFLNIAGRVVIEDGARLVVLDPGDDPDTLSEHGERYDYDLDGAPPGWAGAPYTYDNAVNQGYWNIGSDNPYHTKWGYEYQSPVGFGSQSWNNSALNWKIGPVLWRDPGHQDDVAYTLAMHAEDNGARDLNRYVRLTIQWDTATGVWQMRGESSDGTTPHTGAWRTLSWPLPQPMYVRLVFVKQGGALDSVRIGISSLVDWNSGSLMYSHALSFEPGVPWLYVGMERTGGAESAVLRIGGIDYNKTAMW